MITILGTVIGYPLGMFVPMTAMPQRIAISHMFGALAATLVGVAEFYTLGNGAHVTRATMGALGFEVMFGALTITGSFMAFGKLQELLPSRPVTFRGQNVVSIALFAAAVGLFVWLVKTPANPRAFYAMVGLALVFGVSLVLPIGGADMPVVISLLNSCTGLAVAATGFSLREPADRLDRGLVMGLTGSALVLLLHAAVDSTFHEPALVILLVILGGLVHNLYMQARPQTVMWRHIVFSYHPLRAAYVIAAGLVVAVLALAAIFLVSQSRGDGLSLTPLATTVSAGGAGASKTAQPAAIQPTASATDTPIPPTFTNTVPVWLLA